MYSSSNRLYNGLHRVYGVSVLTSPLTAISNFGIVTQLSALPVSFVVVFSLIFLVHNYKLVTDDTIVHIMSTIFFTNHCHLLS